MSVSSLQQWKSFQKKSQEMILVAGMEGGTEKQAVPIVLLCYFAMPLLHAKVLAWVGEQENDLQV